MSKKFLVTTPIYYPNDKLHIGHAYTTTLADYIARYKKLKGYDVFFLTGSDEHGQKIEDRAKEAGEAPYVFVSKIIESFKKLWQELGIEYNQFIRTTDKEHENFVKSKFTELNEKGFIYKGNYSGFYCKQCESFYTKSQLNNDHCPSCGRPVEIIKEESYFLKISEFQDWIKRTLLQGNILFPEKFVNELINNFVNDLQDLSITRTSFTWGIQLKENPAHVIYVWLDALLNYISAFTYPNNSWTIEDVWSKDSNTEILQLVGKEITRFHSIYWPIMLKMLGYREPKVLAHGWLVTGAGEKMSKSLGNVVDPVDVLKEFGRDALRFYLINNIVTGEDGKFSNELLIENINGILVNKFSNLISRTDAMLKKFFGGKVPAKNADTGNEKALEEKLETSKINFEQSVESFKFSESTKWIIKYTEELNGYIDLTEPWKEENKDKLETILNVLINGIKDLTIMISPILIDSSKKIFEWLKIDNYLFEDIGKNISKFTVGNIPHLFERIK